MSTDARQMPLTLREFSQWLDWVDGGKVGTPVTGEKAPAGSLYSALVYESIAKSAIKPLEADKQRAVEWLTRYAVVGVNTDPQVTTEYRYRELPKRVVPEARKVNSDKFKRRYPRLYEQARDWSPYRQVKLAKEIAAPPAPDPEDPIPMPPPMEELPKATRQWGVTWGQAFHTYQERLEQMKAHKKVIDDAEVLMGRLLTDPKIKAEYEAHWSGHGRLEFTDGSSLQMDQLRFSQDRALEVIEIAEAAGMEIDTGSFIEVVPEHEVNAGRRLVKTELASNDPERAKGLGNPFEGE